MAVVPGGASGLLGRDYKGKEATTQGLSHRPGRTLAGRRTARPRAPGRRGARAADDASPAAITLGMPDDAGGARGAGTEGDGTGEEGAGVHGVFDAQRRPRPAEQPLRGQRAPRLREFRKDRGSTPGEGDDLMIPGVMSWQKANPMAH